MSARPVKRSLTLHGHRTSVSLEAAFWDAFRRLASDRGIPLNQLAAEIDDARTGDEGLASAIRVHILGQLQAGHGQKVSGQN
ncbi:MAG TPA: ribbon-helix-helix domain-containing protein [Tabrizicola sp.]|nr:ribbon-helix-helix domain-containing protein [Tabrizicola sp.]